MLDSFSLAAWSNGGEPDAWTRSSFVRSVVIVRHGKLPGGDK